MNRDRKVTDLYNAVLPVNERDAFLRIIEAESDNNVLSDLRDRFWDGGGAKPWQVKEINRLLTRRQNEVKSDDSPTNSDVHIARITSRQAVLVALISAAAGVLATFISTRGDKTPEPPLPQRYLEFVRVESKNGEVPGSVRVVAEVNGQAFSYPSRAVWAEASATMSTEEFLLPTTASAYRVRFEVLVNLPTGEVARYLSQPLHNVPIAAIPITREYEVYPIAPGIIRQGSSKLVVHYTIK